MVPSALAGPSSASLASSTPRIMPPARFVEPRGSRRSIMALTSPRLPTRRAGHMTVIWSSYSTIESVSLGPRRSTASFAARFRYSILPSSDIEPERSRTRDMLSGGRSLTTPGVEVDTFIIHNDVDDGVATGQHRGLIELNFAAQRICRECGCRPRGRPQRVCCKMRQLRCVAARDASHKDFVSGIYLSLGGAGARSPANLATIRE